MRQLRAFLRATDAEEKSRIRGQLIAAAGAAGGRKGLRKALKALDGD